MNNGQKGIGCGTIFIILIVLFLLIGSCSNSNNSSSSYKSNPIRDRDPEFYDYLEDRYNRMIENEKNQGR